MSKKMTVQDAIGLIRDGDTLAVGGFVGCMHPEDLTQQLERTFKETRHPQNLDLIYAAGQGDGHERGLNHLGHEGMLRRVVGGHWGLVPKIQKLALENKIEAYNFPQGVISHLFRDIAAKKPGTLTHIGLKTFVDPRLQGGRINDITKDDLVTNLTIGGKEYLLYHAFPIHIALVRASYCDPDGNATFERECVSLEVVAMCQAAKNSGGKVILQVEKIVERGSLNPKLIRLPGIYVDAIIEAPPKNHMQTFDTQYDPSYSGDIRIPTDTIAPMSLDERKIIARRCAMELSPGAVTNLGIGMPEGIAAVAAEEGVASRIFLTLECGPIGGVPASGLNFGATSNPDCILDQPVQFDFYDGGGLDIAFLGLAQADASGNVNVSKFGPKIAGCGGFINITQTAKKLVYCGTFTAGGLALSVEDGCLHIFCEGKTNKFIQDVEQITFSGAYALECGQPVLYVTERAVFRLTSKGLMLTEIAPGIDLQRDVLDHMGFAPIISPEIKEMDARIFCDKMMHLEL